MCSGTSDAQHIPFRAFKQIPSENFFLGVVKLEETFLEKNVFFGKEHSFARHFGPFDILPSSMTSNESGACAHVEHTPFSRVECGNDGPKVADQK